jgi:hypothetical protein
MKTNTLRDVLPLLAPAYEVGDHRRAAARLARDVELADDSPEQTACDEYDAEESRLEDALDRMEAATEELRYQRSIASGTIKGDSR